MTSQEDMPTALWNLRISAETDDSIGPVASGNFRISANINLDGMPSIKVHPSGWDNIIFEMAKTTRMACPFLLATAAARATARFFAKAARNSRPFLDRRRKASRSFSFCKLSLSSTHLSLARSLRGSARAAAWASSKAERTSPFTTPSRK